MSCSRVLKPSAALCMLNRPERGHMGSEKGRSWPTLATTLFATPYRVNTTS